MLNQDMLLRLHPTRKVVLLLASVIFFVGSHGQPKIASFSPASGPIGTTVTITGTNFSSVAGNNIVYFGGVKGSVISSSSAIVKPD